MAWDYIKRNILKQKKTDPVWYLERQVNFGNEGKLDAELLKQYLPKLNITENKRAFLELLLWDKPF
ncbi:hypothetical protein HY771_02545 [Candidatus Uhrbacteria bacterium]|nr:hypothetical protein [Candidatus Uhrbacteria bacterium]